MLAVFHFFPALWDYDLAFVIYTPTKKFKVAWLSAHVEHPACAGLESLALGFAQAFAVGQEMPMATRMGTV